MFVLILSTFSICMGLVAMAIVQWSSRIGTASISFVFVLILSLLFSGFLVNPDSITPAVRWISYLSIVKYTYEPLVISEFAGTTFDFAVGGYDAVSGVKGEVFASTLGFDVDKLKQNLWIMVAWFVGLSAFLAFSTYFRFRRPS